MSVMFPFSSCNLFGNASEVKELKKGKDWIVKNGFSNFPNFKKIVDMIVLSGTNQHLYLWNARNGDIGKYNLLLLSV